MQDLRASKQAKDAPRSHLQVLMESQHQKDFQESSNCFHPDSISQSQDHANISNLPENIDESPNPLRNLNDDSYIQTNITREDYDPLPPQMPLVGDEEPPLIQQITAPPILNHYEANSPPLNHLDHHTSPLNHLDAQSPAMAQMGTHTPPSSHTNTHTSPLSQLAINIPTLSQLETYTSPLHTIRTYTPPLNHLDDSTNHLGNQTTLDHFGNHASPAYQIESHSSSFVHQFDTQSTALHHLGSNGTESLDYSVLEAIINGDNPAIPYEY